MTEVTIEPGDDAPPAPDLAGLLAVIEGVRATAEARGAEMQSLMDRLELVEAVTGEQTSTITALLENRDYMIARIDALEIQMVETLSILNEVEEEDGDNKPDEGEGDKPDDDKPDEGEKEPEPADTPPRRKRHYV